MITSSLIIVHLMSVFHIDHFIFQHTEKKASTQMLANDNFIINNCSFNVRFHIDHFVFQHTEKKASKC